LKQRGMDDSLKKRPTPPPKCATSSPSRGPLASSSAITGSNHYVPPSSLSNATGQGMTNNKTPPALALPVFHSSVRAPPQTPTFFNKAPPQGPQISPVRIMQSTLTRTVSTPASGFSGALGSISTATSGPSTSSGGSISASHILYGGRRT